MFFYFSFIILLQLKLSSSQKIRQFNNWEYSFERQLATFEEAAAICSEKNGFLAHAKEDDTLIFLKDQLLSYKVDSEPIEDFLFWIGLNQVNNKYHDWKWTDKQPLVTGERHYNWFKGKPGNIKKKCVGIIYSNTDPESFGKWFNRDCSLPMFFICQYQISSRCSSLIMILVFIGGVAFVLIGLAGWKYCLRNSANEEYRKKRKSKRSKDRNKENGKSARELEMISNIHNL